MSKNIKIVVGIIVVVLVGYVISSSTEKTEVSSVSTIPVEKSTGESLKETVKDTVGISLQIFNALNDFYAASEKDISQAEPDLMGINRNLMEQNRYFKSGINHVSSLTAHPNKIVQLAGAGMVLGATQLITANDELINFLRTVDQTDPKFEQEFTYHLSDYISKEKEGYKNIFISAPQIGYIYFNSATSENPTGPISYKISKSDRSTLLKELDDRFANDMKIDEANYKKTQTHNAILSTVTQIRSYLEHDTYEEANK